MGNTDNIWYIHDTEEKPEMNVLKIGKADLKRLSQNAALCGAPMGGGSVNLLGTPAPGEVLSLTLVLGVFVGAGVWMFRRWGKTPAAPAPTEPSPETTAGSEQEERELVNA